jgi:hypothetical protein
MPYINSDGTVQEERSWFRLSLITDIFWGIANTIALFVQTLINPQAALPKGKFAASNSNRSSSTGGGTKPFQMKGSNIKTLPKSCASGG